MSKEENYRFNVKYFTIWFNVILWGPSIILAAISYLAWQMPNIDVWWSCLRVGFVGGIVGGIIAGINQSGSWKSSK